MYVSISGHEAQAAVDSGFLARLLIEAVEWPLSRPLMTKISKTDFGCLRTRSEFCFSANFGTKEMASFSTIMAQSHTWHKLHLIPYRTTGVLIVPIIEWKPKVAQNALERPSARS